MLLLLRISSSSALSSFVCRAREIEKEEEKKRMLRLLLGLRASALYVRVAFSRLALALDFCFGALSLSSCSSTVYKSLLFSLLQSLCVGVWLQNLSSLSHTLTLFIDLFLPQV